MGVGTRFAAVADCIAMLCLGGHKRLALGSEMVNGFIAFKVGSPAPIFTLSLNLPMHLRYEHSIAEKQKNVEIALCIDWCVRFKSHPVSRFLSWRPIAFPRVLSYSLYLWQQPFLNRCGSSVLKHFPLNCPLALDAARASYYAVEKTFLKLKKRSESPRVKSPATTDLQAT